MVETLPAAYILIADDDADDIDMLTTALKEENGKMAVRVASDGRGVMEALQNIINGVGLVPCVLVMDLNMPRMDGRETVVALKSKAEYKSLPILLFSTAKNKTDDMFAEKWGVKYFQKPDTVEGLQHLARTILSFCASSAPEN